MEERRERREFLRESRERFLQTLHDSDSDDDDGDGESNIERREYDGEETEQGKKDIVTTTVTPLDMNSSAVPLSELVGGDGDKGADCEKCVGKAEQMNQKKKEEARDEGAVKETPFRKMVNAIKKKKSGKRHVSYTHKHHQRKSGRPNGKKTTHSERRKRA